MVTFACQQSLRFPDMDKNWFLGLVVMLLAQSCAFVVFSTFPWVL